MALCKYCENIDPDAFPQVESIVYGERPPVDHELQPSHLMRLSAQNGCAGCRFFLDALAQETSELRDASGQLGFVPSWVEATGDFLQRDRQIWITAPFSLVTDGIAGIPLPLRIDLDLCLAQGAVHPSSLFGYLETGTNFSDGIAEHVANFAAPPSGPYKPIAKDPSSEACMDMVTNWLAKCASHENCPPQAAVPLPTRLIEISREGQECKLYISAPGEKGHYVTLSHCWGSAVTFCLKMANIVELQQVICVEDLSKSFQDAVAITKRLGFRFLWVDAICIIQDSVEDWAHESSLMAGIYRNGSLMISAVAAPDGQHGILRPRNNLRSHNFGRNKELLCQTQSKCYFSNDVHSDEPLHARGWCLQEYIMAPRILHFGKEKLIWECVSRRWAEDFGLADIPSMRLGRSKLEARSESVPFIWHIRPGLEEEGHQAERLAAFYRCISEYTERKLTRSSDKLAALSGLASAFQTPELGAYLAGLWENDLAYGLNWYSWVPRREKHPDDGTEYIAPSWSWASMPGRCKIQDVRRYFSSRERKAEFEHFNATLKPQLLSYHIELATSDPYGRISAASIRLRGYTRSILLWPYPPGAAPKSPNGAILDTEVGPKFHSGHVWMFGPPYEYLPWADFKEWHAPSASDSNETRQFIALPVGMAYPHPIGLDLMLSMLVLDPVEDLEDTYRRVGHVEVFAPSEMDPARWEEKDLTLI